MYPITKMMCMLAPSGKCAAAAEWACPRTAMWPFPKLLWGMLLLVFGNYLVLASIGVSLNETLTQRSGNYPVCLVTIHCCVCHMPASHTLITSSAELVLISFVHVILDSVAYATCMLLIGIASHTNHHLRCVQ